MIRHYELQPVVRNEQPLIFDWDEDAGVVSGRDAGRIMEVAAWGGIGAHPLPWSVEFSDAPLRSKADMAAIVGWAHRLPDDLAPFYPQLPDDGFPDATYTDADGVEVIGRDRITY